jgi:hypothetical protein
MRAGAGGPGPWWVISFDHNGCRITIKFKAGPDGYPHTIRLLTIEGAGPTPGRQALVRDMIAAARRWCEQHRGGMIEAWSLARREDRPVAAAPDSPMLKFEDDPRAPLPGRQSWGTPLA